MAEDFNPTGAQPEQTEPSNPEEKQEAASVKPKTKADLEAENVALLAEVEKLKAENEALKKQIPETPEVKAGHKMIFIKSNSVPAIPKNGKKYVEGQVNGDKFEVLCDHQVEVPDHIAEALRGVILAQANTHNGRL